MTRARLLLCLSFLSLCSVSALGQVTISSGGQASTMHAIPMPPGIAGMVPSLALEYNDDMPNGALGVGWSIKGMSTITRCPASRAIDGQHGAMLMRPTDKLCLDGQRLIQTNALGEVLGSQVNDASGLTSEPPYREFRTEKDSFTRIRAYGAAGGDLDRGPAYFKAWTKSGQVYHFGPVPGTGNTHPDSIVNTTFVEGSTTKTRVATWAVSRIADSVGNYIDYRYEARDVAWGSGHGTTVTPGVEWNLVEVRYTGTPAQAPANKIVFSYADRDSTTSVGHDRFEVYFWGHKRVTVRRLSAITGYINSPNVGALGPASTAVAVRSLRLTYQRSGSTGRSRLVKVTECAGAGISKCMPGSQYQYIDTGAVQYQASAAFHAGPLRNLVMHDATGGSAGVLAGDFNGDGRTDLIRWSADPTQNQLWFSAGAGSFLRSSTFTLNQSAHVLASSNGCHSSMVADFDGDGLSDVLRSAGAGCTPAGNVLYRSLGNGTFSATTLPSAISLEQSSAFLSQSRGYCQDPLRVRSPARQREVKPSEADDYRVAAAPFPLPSAVATARSEPTSTCIDYYRPEAKRYYILDANGDGILDVVTTRLAHLIWNSGWGPVPSEAALCQGMGYPTYTGPCTRVFLGTNTGAFQEKLGLGINGNTVYSDPKGRKSADTRNPYWHPSNVADINADGLQDILSEYTGRWRSAGDGDFVASTAQSVASTCGLPIDFNGDGRADCLLPSDTASQQTLTLSLGAASSPPVTQFNLATDDALMFGLDASGRQTRGVVVDDFNGDGRQDILRWLDNGAKRANLYLSNGDGSFRDHEANLGVAGTLQSVDNVYSFLSGDFLGDGTLQFLRLRSNVSSTEASTAETNQLLVRAGPYTSGDQLSKVTQPTGLSATVGPRVPLTLPVSAGGSYVSDRVVPVVAASSMLDIQPPMYVVSSISRYTGSGTLTSKFRYVGMKADRGGRGVLGFREFHQEDPAPDGYSKLTRVNVHLLTHPYNALLRSQRTYLGSLGDTSAPLLSSTVNVYCDTTSATSPIDANEAAPCPTTAKVTRPYLRRSVDSGNEVRRASSSDPALVVAPLPEVTTTYTFNGHGDGTQTVVQTRATVVAGVEATYTRITDNDVCAPDSTSAGGVVCPNKISGDNWILGRNVRTTSRSSASNLTTVLQASAGSRPLATATQGVPPTPGTAMANGAASPTAPQPLVED